MLSLPLSFIFLLPVWAEANARIQFFKKTLDLGVGPINQRWPPCRPGQKSNQPEQRRCSFEIAHSETTDIEVSVISPGSKISTAAPALPDNNNNHHMTLFLGGK